MNDLIACCSCRNVPEKSRIAFAMYFEGEKVPKVYSGINEIRKFAESLPPEWNVTRYLLALAKSKERYSYYFIFDEESGDVTLQYNLLTGRRVL